jgi:release factor glutamine methyltransferase
MVRSWRQRIAALAIRLAQRLGPRVVRVLGGTYVVSPEVFNPRLYLTSGFMARHVRVRPDDEVLDMGTGSGIQAVVAARVARRVIAVDVNPRAVECARENVSRNRADGVVEVFQSDLFASLPAGSLFDVILFTPPYLEGEPLTEFDRALYDPGKSLAKRFFQEAGRYLKAGGYVQMVYSSIAEPRRVLTMARQYGWQHSVIAQKRFLLETLSIYRLTRSA